MTRIVCVFGFPGMYIYISHIQSYIAYITHEHVNAYKIKNSDISVPSRVIRLRITWGHPKKINQAIRTQIMCSMIFYAYSNVYPKITQCTYLISVYIRYEWIAASGLTYFRWLFNPSRNYEWLVDWAPHHRDGNKHRWPMLTNTYPPVCSNMACWKTPQLIRWFSELESCIYFWDFP